MTKQTYDGKNYFCQNCGTWRSYRPASPPVECNFAFHCRQCNTDTTYQWYKEDFFHEQKDGWRPYQCDNCHTQVWLPDTKKKRDKHVAWQEAGCPPPWWFRPVQLIVLVFFITMIVFFPWWVLGIYCGLAYGLIGYEIASGRMIYTNKAGAVVGFYAPFDAFVHYDLLCPASADL